MVSGYLPGLVEQRHMTSAPLCVKAQALVVGERDMAAV